MRLGLIIDEAHLANFIILHDSYNCLLYNQTENFINIKRSLKENSRAKALYSFEKVPLNLNKCTPQLRLFTAVHQKWIHQTKYAQLATPGV